MQNPPMSIQGPRDWSAWADPAISGEGALGATVPSSVVHTCLPARREGAGHQASVRSLVSADGFAGTRQDRTLVLTHGGSKDSPTPTRRAPSPSLPRAAPSNS